MAFAYSPKIVTDGLVLYLDAANPYSYVSGSTIWNDLSRSQLNGSLVNPPVFNTGSLGLDRSFLFNGTSNVISVADDPILDLANDKTLVCWVSMGADSVGCGIAGKSNNVDRGMALGYGWNGNGFMALLWNARNSPFLVKDLTRDIQKWVCLFAIQNGSTRYIYALDQYGTRSSSTTTGTQHTWNNSQSLMIGNANNATYFAPANTKIAMVSVYNRALSEQEVIQNYNATKGRFGL